MSDHPHPANAHADIHPLLRSRWSPRVFDPIHELFDDEIRQLLEAARWAPSAGNSQPWAFIVGRRDDPTHVRFCELLSRGNKAWVPDASAVIVTTHQVGHPGAPELAYSDYAAYDLGQAAAHLSIQARALGLSTHQFAGFDHERAAEAFEIPDHFKVTTAIAVGQHADEAAVDAAEESLRVRERTPRRRDEFATFVYAERWGNPYGL